MSLEKKIKIGINGFGKMTRYFARVTSQSNDSKLSTISDPLKASSFKAPPRSLAFLSSKYDQDGIGNIGTNSLRAFAVLGAGVSGILSFSTVAYCDEGDHGQGGCPRYPWPNQSILSSYDNSSIRKGQQVFQQVCSSCHSMSLMSRPDVAGMAYADEATKPTAAEIEVVVDGQNEQYLAKFDNGGAYPPDLGVITKARFNGQNYLSSLLAGYKDHPAGALIGEGLHYNPYFSGGAISMSKIPNDIAVESEGGTPEPESQMGNDLMAFLSWTAEPEMEEKNLMGFKWIIVLSLALLQAAYLRRSMLPVLKSRKLSWL